LDFRTKRKRKIGYSTEASIDFPTIPTVFKKPRGMRDPTGDDRTSVGVEVLPRIGGNHDRYRQLSTAPQQTPARAAC